MGKGEPRFWASKDTRKYTNMKGMISELAEKELELSKAAMLGACCPDKGTWVLGKETDHWGCQYRAWYQRKESATEQPRLFRFFFLINRHFLKDQI